MEETLRKTGTSGVVRGTPSLSDRKTSHRRTGSPRGTCVSRPLTAKHQGQRQTEGETGFSYTPGVPTRVRPSLLKGTFVLHVLHSYVLGSSPHCPTHFPSLLREDRRVRTREEGDEGTDRVRSLRSVTTREKETRTEPRGRGTSVLVGRQPEVKGSIVISS